MCAITLPLIAPTRANSGMNNAKLYNYWWQYCFITGIHAFNIYNARKMEYRTSKFVRF